MRAKLRLVLASKFAAIEQESAELDSQLNALAEEMQHRTEVVQQLEAEHAERSTRPPGPPLAAPKSNASRKSLASPSSTPSPPHRVCAISSRRPKNDWPEPTAKPAASKARSPTRTSKSTPSVDNAANSRSNLKPLPSASPASPKRSANCAA